MESEESDPNNIRLGSEDSFSIIAGSDDYDSDEQPVYRFDRTVNRKRLITMAKLEEQ
jgi:hypothetical protein